MAEDNLCSLLMSGTERAVVRFGRKSTVREAVAWMDHISAPGNEHVLRKASPVLVAYEYRQVMMDQPSSDVVGVFRALGQVWLGVAALGDEMSCRLVLPQVGMWMSRTAFNVEVWVCGGVAQVTALSLYTQA